MSAKSFPLILPAVSLAVALAVPANAGSSAAPAAAVKTDHSPAHAWGYRGAKGPANWGSLRGEYATCATGQEQSPIDLADARTQRQDALDFHYQPTQLRLVHNGHTIQANIDPGSYLTIGDERFDLLQFHFHSPSEHAVAGERFPLEVHLVHRSQSGTLAVVGVLFERGQKNLSLDEIWTFMPQGQSEEHRYEKLIIDARDFLPGNVEHYRYAGSLTTPPCSEGVRWHVMSEPLQASEDQINRFLSAVGENARPLQPKNKRSVQILNR